MSQLPHMTNRHKCQIDCTNHDEVITALELKSKDLYYFWRNYEWLYNKYYSEQNQQQESKVQVPKNRDSHENCEREIHGLQQQNDRLVKQNKKLRLQLQTCRKQMSDQQSNNRMEQNYKKELAMERNKSGEYMQMNEKLIAENNKLKNLIKGNEEEFESERTRLVKENKKSLQTIVDLQQALDQFRSRQSVSEPKQQFTKVSEGPSYAELQEFKKSQITTVTSRMRNLSIEAERIVSQQCDGLRRELEERLVEMLNELPQRELQTLIVTLEQ